MKVRTLISLFIIAIASYAARAQCNIQTEMNANGTISKTTESALIYSNATYSMYSQMKHDGIDYYFMWTVRPLDKKTVESETMQILLDNDSTITLEFYDSFRRQRDTSVSFLYLINQPNLLQLTSHAVKQINLNTSLSQKNFILKLHKEQIGEQLKCLLASEKLDKKDDEKKETLKKSDEKKVDEKAVEEKKVDEKKDVEKKIEEIKEN